MSALELTRWDDVRMLAAVLRTGSFTLAARALGTDQSTVSRRIAALEAELGAPLFERTPRGLSPTELGASLREPTERVEAEMHRLADVAVGGERAVRGRVRLATTESLAVHFVVPQVLPALRAAHPELLIELVTSDDAVDLAAREADVGLRFFRTTRGDVVGRRVAELSTAVIGARALIERLEIEPPQVEAGASLPWIALELRGVDSPESRWILQHVESAPVLRCSSYEVQLAAVRAGLGVALLPRALLRVDPQLAVLDALPPGPSLELHVVTRSAIRGLPRVAAVIDALVEHLAVLDAVRPASALPA